MAKLDWIDFGYSWSEDWSEKPVDHDLHASTASLLAQKLRGRACERPKVFASMRTNSGHEVSLTPGVLHVEATFPFATYVEAPIAERLRLFAKWLVQTVSNSASELFSTAEAGELLEALIREEYTYVREDRVRTGFDGQRSCARFIHSPFEVDAYLLMDRGRQVFRFPPRTFRRDELDYGRSVASCVAKGEKLWVRTGKGDFELSNGS